VSDAGAGADGGRTITIVEVAPLLGSADGNRLRSDIERALPARRSLRPVASALAIVRAAPPSVESERLAERLSRGRCQTSGTSGA
jgi:hypothetical protein